MGAFRLPSRYLPGFRTQSQYSDQVEINRANPITDKLVGCYVATPAGMFDLVSHEFAVKEGGWEFQQGASQYDGVNDDEYFSSPIGGAPNWTIGCSTKVLSAATDRRFMAMGGEDGNYMLGLGTSGSPSNPQELRGFYRNAQGTSTSFYIGTAKLLDSITHNSIVLENTEGSMYSGLYASAWSALPEGNTFNPDYISFGAIKRASLSHWCDCRIHLGWIFDRVMNADEIRQLHANPRQLLRPRIPVFYSLPEPTAGPGLILRSNAA